MENAISIDPSTLTNPWTATVVLKNGLQIDVWYTAWPMAKKDVAAIVSILSDFPKHEIQR